MTGVDQAFAPLAGVQETPVKPKPWTPLLPVPGDAPALTRSTIVRFAPANYQLTDGWRYHDAHGRLLGSTVRFDPADGGEGRKQILPFTFCAGPESRREWRVQGFPAPRPLYGLDRLAAKPEATILVVEGEKTADAARSRFPDLVTVTSPGGSRAARKADWSALAGRDVIVWPDADHDGADYAVAVEVAARSAGARSVRVVSLPPGLPDKWDLADALPADLSEADLHGALSGAREAKAELPLPLFATLPAGESYPVAALGPVLSRAAAAIARKVQVPEAIAAQSVLAAAALAAQAHADIVLPYGQTRPLSLYLVTVAASGDRKTTADNEALWPIRKRERLMKELHDQKYQTWVVDHAAWAAEKRKIEANRKMDIQERRFALRDLGPEPERPLHPFLTAPDPTVEGLAKAWPNAPASLGIFTAEGGQFIGGHGMSADNRLKSAAVFSELWDGQPVKRIRAVDGVTLLLGRRLSLHLMVQPDAAGVFLSDRTLRDQGLLSRVMVAAPDSIAGNRYYRETSIDDDAAIRAYGARLLSILETRSPLADGERNVLEPRRLAIAPDAAMSWRAFFDHVEGQCGRERDLWPIQDFAAKAAEHAARIAGVLTVVADVAAESVSVNTMDGAIQLADWYVNEALRLHGAARTDPRLLRAQQLLEWLQARDAGAIEFRDIVRLGPSPLRTKAAAEEAVALLIAHGWVTEAGARPRQLRLRTTGNA